jgi:5S rRNA maturation endonuclease (ribonuclease M5)
MPSSSEIIVAVDADREGAKLAEIVRRAVEHSGRSDLHFTLQEALRAQGLERSAQSKTTTLQSPVTRSLAWAYLRPNFL